MYTLDLHKVLDLFWSLKYVNVFQCGISVLFLIWRYLFISE